MNYLFFDIECCNCHHICEFGYVLTDDKFNIIKKEELLINPAKEFTVPKDDKFKGLSYSQEEYLNNPSFREYYDKIKNIINNENQIIFGYAINNDAVYLRTACKRYKLKPISFTFYDIQIILSKYFNLKEQISLEKAVCRFNLENDAIYHRAIDDALSTLNIAKKLSKESNLKLEDLINNFESCKGRSNNNYIFNYEKEREKNFKIKQDELRKKLNNGRLNYTIGDLYQDIKK